MKLHYLPFMKNPFFLICLLVFSFASSFAQDDQEDEKLIKSVFFGGGSYYIDADQVMEIKEFLESVENIESYQISIYSHTDNIGGVEYNQWLSGMRSQSTLEQLLRNDILYEKIHIESQGQKNPLYDNDSWMGRQGNRRVDIILWPIVM